MSYLRSIASLVLGLIVAMSALADGAIAADQEEQGWADSRFEACLHAFNERALSDGAADASAEVYRVYFLPSFESQVSMRVDVWRNGRGRVTLRSAGKHCFGSREPIMEQRRGLLPEEVAAVRAVLDDMDFWNRTPLWNETEGEKVICSDGASIYIEGLRGGRYHRIYRSCLWTVGIEAVDALFHRLARVPGHYP